MLYVLKYNGLFEGDFVESFYDEVVSVKNRIAVVQMDHNKEQLLGRQFDLIGQVEGGEDVKALLNGDDVEIQVRKERVEQPVPASKMVSKDSILPGKPEGVEKSWYENLE